MVPVFVAAAAAVAAIPHIIAAGWVASIATDPLAEDSRKELLDHVESVLSKLETLGRSPSKTKLNSLRADLGVLREKMHHGWVQWAEFVAALRVTNFVVFARTKSTAGGICELINNSLDKAVSAIFPPPANTPQTQE